MSTVFDFLASRNAGRHTNCLNAIGTPTVMAIHGDQKKKRRRTNVLFMRRRREVDIEVKIGMVTAQKSLQCPQNRSQGQ